MSARGWTNNALQQEASYARYMCGRYAIKIHALESWQQYVRLEPLFGLADSYNVAPTQPVPIARLEDGQATAAVVRWGLIPYFCKGEPPKYSTINARIETVETAASYRGPWKRGQRCLQFASGFYEWHLDANGVKQPYYIHLADQDTFAFAGLWDRSVKPDGRAIESCVHITMPGNEMLREIHNTGSNPHRMPAILRREDALTWLTGTTDQARGLLQQYPSGLMVAYPVSKAVNTPKSNTPELIEPVEVQAPEAS